MESSVTIILVPDLGLAGKTNRLGESRQPDFPGCQVTYLDKLEVQTQQSCVNSGITLDVVELSPTQRVVQRASECFIVCAKCWLDIRGVRCHSRRAACSVWSCRAGLSVSLSLGCSSRRSTLLADRPFPRCSCSFC